MAPMIMIGAGRCCFVRPRGRCENTASSEEKAKKNKRNKSLVTFLLKYCRDLLVYISVLGWAIIDPWFGEGQIELGEGKSQRPPACQYVYG